MALKHIVLDKYRNKRSLNRTTILGSTTRNAGRAAVAVKASELFNDTTIAATFSISSSTATSFVGSTLEITIPEVKILSTTSLGVLSVSSPTAITIPANTSTLVVVGLNVVSGGDVSSITVDSNSPNFEWYKYNYDATNADHVTLTYAFFDNPTAGVFDLEVTNYESFVYVICLANTVSLGYSSPTAEGQWDASVDTYFELPLSLASPRELRSGIVIGSIFANTAYTDAGYPSFNQSGEAELVSGSTTIAFQGVNYAISVGRRLAAQAYDSTYDFQLDWNNANPEPAIGAYAIWIPGAPLTAFNIASSTTTSFIAEAVAPLSGIVAETQTFILAGTDVPLTRNRTLVVDAGNYTASFVFSAVDRTRAVQSTTQTYDVYPWSIGLLHQHVLKAEAGVLTSSFISAIATAQREARASSTSYVLTGLDVNITLPSLFLCDMGVFTLTNVSSAVTRDAKLTAETGVFTESGFPSVIKHTRRISVLAEAYALLGNVTLLEKGYVSNAPALTYNLTGFSTSALKGSTIQTNTGNYVLTAEEVTLVATNPNKFIYAVSGAFTYTTNSADLFVDRLVNVDTVGYALGGNNVGVLRNLILATAERSYTLSSYNLSFDVVRASRIIAETGVYSIVGSDVGIVSPKWMTCMAGMFVLDTVDSPWKPPVRVEVPPSVYYITDYVAASFIYSGAFHPVVTADTAVYAISSPDMYIHKGSKWELGTGKFYINQQNYTLSTFPGDTPPRDYIAGIGRRGNTISGGIHNG